MLTAVPLPDWLLEWRPAWVAMVLVYWCMALPERVGIGSAWLLGLLVDALTGSLLGQHALGFIMVAYIVVKIHQRIRVFPAVQVAFVVGLLVVLHLLLMLWVKGMTGLPPHSWAYWAPAATSVLIWPWLFLLLRDLRRKAHVT
jgi:rod shape-determining protein MreD